jgi:outer membrane protein TolC
VLDRLVAEALRANPNVRTAGLRIMEARAQLGIAGSSLYPQVQQATGDVLWAGEHKGKRIDPLGGVVQRGPARQLGARFLGQVPAQHRGRRRRLLGEHRPVRRHPGADGISSGLAVCLDPHRRGAASHL